MSRSASPLPQVYDQPVSPPAFGGFHHATGSPLRKPQSPPALIILNQPSPSPSLPPILTTTAASGSNNARGGVQQPVRNSSSGGGGAGGLLPPANPALEHFTGMAGISPIGPSTDGPMIYIQPSTPISGLKDGRGVFEAAIRRAGANGPQDRQGRNQKGRPQGQQSGQQRDDFNVPPPASHPLLRNASGDQYTLRSNQASGVDQQNNDFNAAMQFPNAQEWGDLRPSGQMRPRAKSDSFMGASASDLFDRQMLAMAGNPQQGDWAQAMQPGIGGPDLRSTIDNWRAALIGGQDEQQVPNPTLDPRTLPGNQDESAVQDFLQQLQVSQQYSRLQAQRSRLPSLNTNTATTQSGVFQYKPGEFSPTSLAFYQQLGINPTNASQLAGTSSAPYSQSNFQNVPQNAWPQTAIPAAQSFLAPDQPGLGPRRRSFAEGTNHPASGAGTPGYGMGFTTPLSLNPARLRAGSPGVGHRRAVQSEDLGRGGAGWGMAGAGSTCVAFMVYKRFKAEDPLSTDFLNSITANDGTLLPPSRGRSNSHSRQSSGSSVRSVSPALSISSQGSSYSHHSPRMDMDDPGIPQRYQENKRKKVAKMKVTSMATEVASSSRRTNDGVFVCPSECLRRKRSLSRT